MSRDLVYRSVKVAIAKGILVRPDKCQRCGKVPPPTSDGRAGVQAHHHDYSKPMDVEWICAKCHRAETPLPAKPGAPAYGEKNGQAKLSIEQVAEIRNSPMGCKRLARIYGVNPSTIRRVRNGTHWREAGKSSDKQESKNDQH